MAIKANASSQGGSDFKRFVGVGSFRVLGVNPTKEELEKFYGREVNGSFEYLKQKEDPNDLVNDQPKKYKQLRVSFMIQADKKYEDGKDIDTNAALEEPLKTTVNFFIDSRYRFNTDKTKVQVIDKYGRTAWVTVEQAKNHQIPIYSNGPARLDKDYRPAYRGEAELTQFILNYLNVTPIESYNKNTGEWMMNPHPEDCEGNLSSIQNYFNGDISELKEYASMMPNNRVKLCVGIRTDDEGKQYSTVYSRFSMRNGAKSFTALKDDIEGNGASSDVYTDDPAGIITNIHEYKAVVKETEFADPFATSDAASDLPFGGDSDDPFANMA